jgi:hypothetical protein
MAIDRFDPLGQIDGWAYRHQDLLKLAGVYLEHPGSTPGWSHWQTRKPKSGVTVFTP